MKAHTWRRALTPTCVPRECEHTLLHEDVSVYVHFSAYLHARLGELVRVTVPECLSSGLCVQL